MRGGEFEYHHLLWLSPELGEPCQSHGSGERAIGSMQTFLIAVGCLWFAAALLIVAGFCAAARRQTPPSFLDLPPLKTGRNRRRNSASKESPVKPSPSLFPKAKAAFSTSSTPEATSVPVSRAEMSDTETVANTTH